ncbi:MAG: cyclic nucleotide-binding domain-containing protein, partial [Candidatus Zixiibacteriota bacterium]
MKLANLLLDKIDTVRKIPFFASLADAEARKVAQHFVEKKIARGDYLFWEGDPAEWMYVIKEGKVKLLKSTSLGKEITIELIPPGQVCGTAVIYSPTHLSSAVAESPTTAWGLRR